MGRSFSLQRQASSWRRIALHTWRDADDPSVYGLLDVDVSEALRYLSVVRERTGVHVTLTHLVGKAVGEALRERPDVNAIVRRGRQVWLRDSIDVFFQVAFEGGENLSGAKIAHVDRKSLVELATELSERATKVRAKQDRELGRTHQLLERVPRLLRRPVIRTMAYLTYDIGADLRPFGIPYDQFGSAMVTNVGGFGLPVALAPIVPFSHCPILIAVGTIRQAPVAVDGEVVVRPIVTFGATFDHRLLDGYEAGKLAARFRECLDDPERAFGLPESVAAAAQ